MQHYTEYFHSSHATGSLRSAQEIVPLVMELIKPKRVIDGGCSLGNWLSVFKEHGVEEILGLDGDYVDLKLLKIPPECFHAHDLAKPVKIQHCFDLVVSLEVAEHLPIESAESFINTLVNLGLVVLFSAAVPYQPGSFHVNCQWPDHWIKIFNEKGYVLFDCLRMKFWQNKDVEWWYAQNMFLFVKQDCINNYPLLQQNSNHVNMPPLSIVHPKLYLLQQDMYDNLQEYWNPNNISINRAYSLLMQVVKRKLNKIFLRNGQLSFNK